MTTITHTATPAKAKRVPTTVDLLSQVERHPGKRGSLQEETVDALVALAAESVRAAGTADAEVKTAESQVISLTEALTAARTATRTGAKKSGEARAIVARVVYVVTTQGPTGSGVRLAKDLGISQGEVSKYKTIGAAMASTHQHGGAAYGVFRGVIDATGKTTVVETVVANAQGKALAMLEGETPKDGVRVSLEHLGQAVAEVNPPKASHDPEAGVPDPVKVTTLTRRVRALVDQVNALSKASALTGDAADVKYLVDAVAALGQAVASAKVLAK